MTAITATFTSLPFTQFRKHRHFYLWYDGVWAVLLAGVLALDRLALSPKKLKQVGWTVVAANALAITVLVTQ